MGRLPEASQSEQFALYCLVLYEYYCNCHFKGTPYKFKKFSNLAEAEIFIVENNTKKENEEKENRNENFSNPEKKPKLDLLPGENRTSGENLKARKVSKTYLVKLL